MSTDPDQIRSEIDQTQRELSADVDALTEKLSPPRMVERQVRHTRTVMSNMKDRIMGTASDASSGVGETIGSRASAARDTAASKASAARDTAASKASAARDTAASKASSAVDTARSAPDLVRRRTEGNPLAVGLIAFGAGWLLSSLLPASAPEQQVATQVKDFAAEQGGPVAQQLGQAGQQLRESAQEHAEAVRDTAADAASAVTGHAQSAASDVAGQARDSAGQVRDQAGPSSS